MAAVYMCSTLVTIGRRGYERSGIGSEVLVGEGVIGTAASECRPVRLSDMSRVRRFSSAVNASPRSSHPYTRPAPVRGNG